MDCTHCEIYIRTQGVGVLECKKCHKYRQFQIKSSPRPQLIYESLPDLIREACADQECTRSILDHLQHIPRPLAVPLLLHCALDMTLQDIADYHAVSRGCVARRIKQAATLLRVMVRGTTN